MGEARRGGLDRGAGTLGPMRRQHVTEPRGRRRDGPARDAAWTGSRPTGGGATSVTSGVASGVASGGGAQPGAVPSTAGREAVRDPRAQGKATRGPDEVATRRHLEGAEQGPM